MQYYDFDGSKISALGFGTRHLPTLDGDDSRIDQVAAASMVVYAMEHGVNYFDTGWDHHGGNAELVLGRSLAPYARERFNLADKFPGYDISNFGKHEEIFEEQLKKCQVEYFDFYLLHNISETNIDYYLNAEQYGVVEYFIAQRDAGRIKHLGFSSHGSFDPFKRFMDTYSDQMEFCQLQLNYMDWKYRNAQDKVEYLQQHNIPIFAMEPMHGGNLIKLTEGEMKQLQDLRPGKSSADWAIRYIAGIPGVATILSNMSTPHQVRDNIIIVEDEDELTAEQREVIETIGRYIANTRGVPCTACRYCMPHCPKQLEIPNLLNLYNDYVSSEDGQYKVPMAIAELPDNKKPWACISCGECSGVCPQQIAIPETLIEFSKLIAG